MKRQDRPRLIYLWVIASALALLSSDTLALAHPAHAGKIIAQSGDAYIAYDEKAQMWQIGTAGIVRTVDFDAGNGFQLESLVNRRTDREWLAPGGGQAAELHLILNGEVITGAASDFAYSTHSVHIFKDGSLELHLEFARPGLTAHYYYVAFPKTNVIEQWVAVENTGTEPLQNLTSLDSFSVRVQPSAERLTLYWVAGASPQSASSTDPQPLPSLRLHSARLADGASARFGSLSRSSQESMGWFVLHSPSLHEGMFGGIEWSGSWQLQAARDRGQTALEAGIGGIRTDLAPGKIFQSPRRFVGFYRGDLDDAANASHEFVRGYLLRPRPGDFPWTSYNTWFAHYLDMNETLLKHQVDLARELGIEVFILDAGWHEGSPNTQDLFSQGLGNWIEDREKFPSGLRAFSDYVHRKGMKFGLWVEPERVDLAFAGEGTEIPYAWLAPGAESLARAADDTLQTAQICFGNADAREWTKRWLARVIRDYRVDWLVWDNNILLSCNPPGALGIGDYAHTMGLYEVLDYLRAQFPNLIIENCASGGNRMDYALMRRTDIAWLSDQTDPSYRVRYHVTGASYPFPPEYLNSALVDSYFEPLTRAAEARYFQSLARSRMMGAFQLSFPLEGLTPEQRLVLGSELERYKSVRGIIAHGKIFRLLPQNDTTAELEPPEDPDGAEFYDEASRTGVVFLFQGKTPWERRRVMLKGLDPNARYQVAAGDGSINLVRTGQQLMRAGISFPYDASRPSVILYIAPN